jgi:hypothetical protein
LPMAMSCRTASYFSSKPVAATALLPTFYADLSSLARTPWLHA